MMGGIGLAVALIEYGLKWLFCAVVLGIAVALAVLAWMGPPAQVPRLTVVDVTAVCRADPEFGRWFRDWELHEIRVDGERVGILRHWAEDGRIDFEYGLGLTVDLGTTQTKHLSLGDRLLWVAHRPVSGWFVDSESHALWVGDELLGLLVLHRSAEPRLQFRPAAGGRVVDLYPLLVRVK